MKLFFSSDYVLSEYSFDTTRKSQWIADSLVERPIRGVEVVAPSPLTEAEIRRVHDPAYVAAIKTGDPRHLAESQGFAWDEGLWKMVCASNGGAVQASRAARRDGASGSLSSGLHHARRDRGAGFCTFNGLVLAAVAALDEGARSVLVLDLDAHCGGGTHSLVAADKRIRQLDVALSPFDSYAPTGHNTLDLVDDPQDYLATLNRRLAELDGVEIDLCLYNAGMDVDRRSAIGGGVGLDLDQIAQREAAVFDWATARNLPIAFVLAGGYTGPRLSQRELVELHRMTLQQAARI